TLEMSSDDGKIKIEAKVISQFSDSFLIDFRWTPEHYSFLEIIHHFGKIPLPPYMKRDAMESDRERYQTIYSKTEGSVAAPTAGLHFTERLMHNLHEKNIKSYFVTLHVGAGTFKPVKSATMEHHEMHAEYIDVSIATIKALSDQEKIYAVGTTSLRTLESLFILGCIIKKDPQIEELPEIDQWAPYSLGNENISRKESFMCLHDWLLQKDQEKLITKTSILIAPGYKPKTIDGLITNFHQPNSTLLLLVAALIGDDWKRVYQYALEHQFRFLSYGDGCLLEP
ncbi:MAG: S-adenosylmethionine:tRNA ribosyltransferase-isomerase, partial [Chitinophagaceae bacterium]